MHGAPPGIRKAFTSEQHVGQRKLRFISLIQSISARPAGIRELRWGPRDYSGMHLDTRRDAGRIFPRYLFPIKLPADGNHRNNTYIVCPITHRYRGDIEGRYFLMSRARHPPRGRGNEERKGENTMSHDLISHLWDFDAKHINISFEQN